MSLTALNDYYFVFPEVQFVAERNAYYVDVALFGQIQEKIGETRYLCHMHDAVEYEYSSSFVLDLDRIHPHAYGLTLWKPTARDLWFKMHEIIKAHNTANRILSFEDYCDLIRKG